VSQLPRNTTDSDLIQAFSYFGKVKSGYVIRDNGTEKTLSFGYVTFKVESSAREAMNHPCFIVHGMRVICKTYKSKKEVQMDRNNYQDINMFKSRSTMNYSDFNEGNSLPKQISRNQSRNFDAPKSPRPNKI
jgi:RNA recognition motif-containing protein